MPKMINEYSKPLKNSINIEQTPYLLGNTPHLKTKDEV
jgi:hypothetical protein